MAHICLFQTAYYLYCCVYTPHPPSLLKHFYLYCSTPRNICPKSVSYMSVERGQVTMLWWLIIYIVVFTPLTHLLSWSTFICIVVHCEIFVQNQCRTCRPKEVRLRRSDDFILNKRCVAQIIFSKTLESCVLFLLQWSRTAFASKVHRTRNVRECVTMTL